MKAGLVAQRQIIAVVFVYEYLTEQSVEQLQKLFVCQLLLLALPTGEFCQEGLVAAQHILELPVPVLLVLDRLLFADVKALSHVGHGKFAILQPLAKHFLEVLEPEGEGVDMGRQVVLVFEVALEADHFLHVKHSLNLLEEVPQIAVPIQL